VDRAGWLGPDIRGLRVRVWPPGAGVKVFVRGGGGGGDGGRSDPAMLGLDRRAAGPRKLYFGPSVRRIDDDLSMSLAAGSFDLVCIPVEQVVTAGTLAKVYAQVAA